MQVACSTQLELQEWLDLLTKHTHTPATPTHRPQSVCHTVSHRLSLFTSSTQHLFPPVLLQHLLCFQLPSQPATPSRHSESRGGSVGHAYHTLPRPPSFGTGLNNSSMWGPLEPPSTPKPWSLSCLRPAPPLRPSAALCLKEVLSTYGFITAGLEDVRRVRFEPNSNLIYFPIERVCVFPL